MSIFQISSEYLILAAPSGAAVFCTVTNLPLSKVLDEHALSSFKPPMIENDIQKLGNENNIKLPTTRVRYGYLL